MFISNDLGIHGSKFLDLGTGHFSMLDHNKSGSNQGCTTNIANGVIAHGFNNSHGLTRSSASTGNT